ncbi:MAG: hypothetical protein ORN27_06915 [Rhodoluna sp.]|nr:hypothetical protein [Rhodoluna sp.]
MKKNIIGGASLLAAGLIAGSLFSISGANAAPHHTAKASHAKAAVVTPTPAPSTTSTPNNHTPETPITGDLATTLSNLALAKYPGATIVRVESDSDGAVSEVHLTTADGKDVNITFDANNAIVDTKVGGPGFGGHGHHGFGGHGDNDGDGPGAGFTPSAPSTPVTPLNG